MQFYLGPLGDLQALPLVERDKVVEATAEAPIGEHTSLTGALTVDRMGPHRRTWTLSWVYLTQDEVDELDAIRRGLLGFPLWLVDPQRPNLAAPQVATTGTERRTVDGWTSTSGARRWKRLDTRPSGVRAVGAIEWERSTIADVLSVGRNTPAQRTPLLRDGLPVSVGARLRRTSTQPVIVRLGIDLFHSDGSRTTSFANPATPAQNEWIDQSHTTTPPNTAVAFAPCWSVDAGQPASVFHIAGVRCGYGSTPPAPSTGGGAALVYPRAMPETYRWQDESDAGLTLVEM